MSQDSPERTGLKRGEGRHESGGPSLRILTVVNFRLPASDYRLQFAVRNRAVRVVFGLPERPAPIPESDYVRLRFGEGVRPIELLEFVRLFLWLRRERAHLDFVQLFSTKLFLFGPFVARLAGVRSITTMTGFGRVFNGTGWWWRVVRPVFLLMLGCAFRCSDVVLFQNHGDMARVVERFPSIRGKSHYIGSAVALEVNAEKRFDTDPLVVLLVSRLQPSKGVEDFLHVASELRHGGFRFVLVGPASGDYPGLATRVEKAAADGVVTYAGVQGADELRAVYEEAHIFLFPSYGEGMARVMLEAGVAGLCPVAYDINANRDVVKEGCGFLVPVGDRTALIAGLRELRASRGALASAAQRYRRHVMASFSVEAYEDRLMKVLKAASAAESRAAR